MAISNYNEWYNVARRYNRRTGNKLSPKQMFELFDGEMPDITNKNKSTSNKTYTTKEWNNAKAKYNKQNNLNISLPEYQKIFASPTKKPKAKTKTKSNVDRKGNITLSEKVKINVNGWGYALKLNEDVQLQKMTKKELMEIAKAYKELYNTEKSKIEQAKLFSNSINNIDDQITDLKLSKMTKNEILNYVVKLETHFQNKDSTLKGGKDKLKNLKNSISKYGGLDEKNHKKLIRMLNKEPTILGEIHKILEKNAEGDGEIYDSNEAYKMLEELTSAEKIFSKSLDEIKQLVEDKSKDNKIIK